MSGLGGRGGGGRPATSTNVRDIALRASFCLLAAQRHIVGKNVAEAYQTGGWAMWAVVEYHSIAWERVRRLTFVPYLDDGRCALLPVGSRLALPSGEVLDGEDPMLDTGLRVLLVTAGFRRQGFHPFAADGEHVDVWCEGDAGYRGARPHAEVELWKGAATEAAARLRAAGDTHAAGVVEAADRALPDDRPGRQLSGRGLRQRPPAGVDGRLVRRGRHPP
jgi:hypothetical protein